MYTQSGIYNNYNETMCRTVYRFDSTGGLAIYIAASILHKYIAKCHIIYIFIN